MEEKKLKKVETAKNNESEKKLSYEELNNVCVQLEQQNQYLVRQLQQTNMVNMFKRLDYLFKVLEFSSVIKDAEFINSCVEEIKEAMTVPAKEEE